MRITTDAEGLAKLANDLAGQYAVSTLSGDRIQFYAFRNDSGSLRFRVNLSKGQEKYLIKSKIPERTIEDVYGL